MDIPHPRSLIFADPLHQQLRQLAWQEVRFGADRAAAPAHPWWRSLARCGTRPWLDTGDLDGAGALWCSSFDALTTNNSLLNHEVQKGRYDGLITATAPLTQELPPTQRIIEAAFLLNAHHGLRLASRFGGRVSVELHTALADDVERSIDYGRRLFSICPDHFIIKIPLTPAGLLATRRLRLEGIPVNLTLGFSARQNLLAAALAAPNYVNVFLGRINAYVADNQLGDGVMAGEKATLASQRAVRERTAANLVPTQQIAASLRSGSQVAALAGVDVQTIPLGAAREAQAAGGPLHDRRAADPPVELAGLARGAGLEDLWTITHATRALADTLESVPPLTPEALVERCSSHGLGGLFPSFTPDEARNLARDGKIPRHAYWAARLVEGTCTIDGLLSAAALASFRTDQAALDERIRGLL